MVDVDFFLPGWAKDLSTPFVLHRHMRVSTVIRLLTYCASMCEEVLYTVLRVICVTGSVQDGSRAPDTSKNMSFC